MRRFNPKDFEPKWQQAWRRNNLYEAIDFDQHRPKFVMLTEFPYPSGDGLHLGHVREYTLGDIIARHKRMTGCNVLFPMGYDAFGLPTENFAIKNKIAPQRATVNNISNFQEQFDALGFSIDWSRSFSTTDPEYYKWTQWLFLQFYKAGLAYQAEIAINWCPKCKTGLANEEVVNGKHERCDTPVEKKTLQQWMLAITKYADRLIDGLATVDYPEKISSQQINWIGRSVGAEINFKIDNRPESSIRVFTTRPDTLFGSTFMVLAPEHPLIEVITTKSQLTEVEKYKKTTEAKSEIERQDTDREKTGVFTGAYAINPVNNERIPIWIADYVLIGYGTGAIMAVPAHDERDYEFAQKYDIPIKIVIRPVAVEDYGSGRVLVVKSEGEYLTRSDSNDLPVFNSEALATDFIANNKFMSWGVSYGLNNNGSDDYVSGWVEGFSSPTHKKIEGYEWVCLKNLSDLSQSRIGLLGVYNEKVYNGEGVMINSGKYDGMNTAEAREKIIHDLKRDGVAKVKINYKLRDWIFSRQHYWGEPIPIIHCDEHGAVPVPEEQLPVVLPEVDHYEPTDSGESPLAEVSEWVNTTCPICGKLAKRETDTMPNWAGSSWYYLRYFDPRNDKTFAGMDKLKYWGEVDLYLGGMEHTTLHLLYSRFWHQFLYDQKLVPNPEPYHARRGQGIILAEDGSKMSKSKGNVVNPNEYLAHGYGADSLRMAIVFLAPYDQTTVWNAEIVAGTFRFLQRFWMLVQEHQEATIRNDIKDSKALNKIINKTIKSVSDDLHDMNFNTAIAALMTAVNELYKYKIQEPVGGEQWSNAICTIIQLLAPFAPHTAEELWQQLGNEGSVHTSSWPVHDESYLIDDIVTIAVQINGKLRGELDVQKGADKESVIAAARQHKKIRPYVEGKDITREIYVPDRLVNLVVS